MFQIEVAFKYETYFMSSTLSVNLTVFKIVKIDAMRTFLNLCIQSSGLLNTIIFKKRSLC
jgi:hypothetical protein